MNAQQLLRKAILLKAVDFENIEPFNVNLDGAGIDNLYSGYDVNSELFDAWEEIRCGGIDAKGLLPVSSSRYYEIDAVAINIDGVWVAYDFWHGGGKYGEPSDYDFIEDARIVNCEEKQVMVTVYNFSEKA